MEVAGDVVPLNSHARRDVFLGWQSGGRTPGGGKESCGAWCPGQTKRGNCMKNRLSLLAVRGRGFRRSCSRCCFPSEECENGRQEGTKKGGWKAPQQMRRVRRERACFHPFSSPSSSSVIPLFSLIIFCMYNVLEGGLINASYIENNFIYI